VGACLVALGCADESAEPESAAQPAASASGSAVALVSDGFVLPPERPREPNPLGLPAASLDAAEDQRAFAVPADMLAGAEIGSAMMLRAATLEGRDGDELMVRVEHGPLYPLHPGYLVVPRPGRFQRNTEVIAAYRGKLQHGVVSGLYKDKVVVRFTDLGFKLGDQRLERDRVGVLGPGLVAGAYAVYRAATELRHVLLVSAATHPEGVRWLVIEHAGASRLIDADKLTRLPVGRFAPKVGASAMVAWRGSMVHAQVRSIDEPGLYTVKRARAGAPLLVGPQMMMPPE
jgi:hypothetical protein